jgi:hypothetical protein
MPRSVSRKQERPCQLISIQPPENLLHDYTSLQDAGEKTYNNFMASSKKPILKERARGGGKVAQTGSSSWHMEIPKGPSGIYRLAQLDDYAGLSRRSFPWTPPFNLRLRGRASTGKIPGTWGFGLWNDPFGIALIKGAEVRLPTLPNTAWFFFASPPNYLSFQDDLPGRGQLAATFQSPGKLPLGLIVRFLLLPLVIIRPISRWLRRSMNQYVHQETLGLDHDPTRWHTYEIGWQREGVIFRLDGQVLMETNVGPSGPLGLVIWVDNQYAYWEPNGGLGYGTLKNSEVCWIELDDLKITFA